MSKPPILCLISQKISNFSFRNKVVVVFDDDDCVASGCHNIAL